ncbi:MAG: DMT family transporter [Desulfobacteraceae bacterium]|nr:DMT family transporter [Desulfobacteraceae bacterium]
MKNKLSNNKIPLGSSIFIALICTIFGASAVAIKFSLTGLGAFTNAGIRFSLSALTIYLWARFNQRTLKINKKQFLQLLLLSLFFIIQSSCFYLGLTKTTVSHGTLIANLLPFFVLVLAHYFIPEDRFTLKKGVGVTVGFIGVLFLFLDSHQISNDIRTGDLIMLVAVLFWSFNAIFSKKIIKNFSSLQITWYPMLFAIPIFFIGGYLFDPEMIKEINLIVVGAVLFQSIVATSFAFVAWNMLIRKFGPTSLHSYVYIMPLAGVIFGVLLLDEQLTRYLIISIILIVFGIIYVNKE